MSTTIEETVTQALSARGYSSYLQYARPVIDQLVERETDIADQLLNYAETAGADLTEVRDLMHDLGMATPAEEEEPEEDGLSEDRADTLSRVEAALLRVEQCFGRINSRLDNLEQLARRYGFNG